MKNLFSIIVGCIALLSVYSCSDDAYTSKYADPSKTATVTCEKLMTGVFYTGKTYSMASYWRLFTFETYFLGRNAQVLGFKNNKDVYAGMGVSYNNDRWTGFYDMLAQFNLLKQTYNKLSDDEKALNKIYVDCAQIYMYDQLEQMVDLWGDVPYTKASTLQLTGSLATSYPSYDKGTTLYTNMMDSLKVISTELGNMTITSEMSSNMSNQDFVNNGSVSKWIKYANGLRMRLAMRCATQGDLSATGQSVLKDIFNGSTTMVSGSSDEILIDVAAKGGDFEMLDKMGIESGWETWSGQCNRASKVMLNAMGNGSNNVDPRLPIMFDSNRADGKYVGMSTDESAQAQSDNFANGKYYSAVDSATFSRNKGYINPVLTAAEVDLTKAEAIARGYITGDAKAAFIKGVEESINFYYKLNAASTYHTAVTKPTDAVIAAYAESKWSDSDPITAICTQKWLNFSFTQMTQAYFEVRRTGIPALNFVSYKNVTSECYNPVDRLKYPTDEVNYNATNLATELNTYFGGTDTWYQKIFWSKDVGTWFTNIAAVQ